MKKLPTQLSDPASWPLPEGLMTRKLVAIGCGADAVVYIVFENEASGNNSKPSGELIPEHNRQRSYTLISIDDGAINIELEITLSLQVHHVQSYSDGFVFVSSRSRYWSPENVEQNAAVLDKSGNLQRLFLLGDGIQDVQITKDDRVWVSYFDEGVFGNFGWTNPVGASGLVCWGLDGTQQYQFSPPEELDFLADCYALNVPNEYDTWCYYYTDFPLVHIKNYQIVSHWQMPVHGSSAFAISDEHVLLLGSFSDRSKFHLYKLVAGGKAYRRREFHVYENGDVVAPELIVARGDSIFFVSKSRLYRVRVIEAIL